MSRNKTYKDNMKYWRKRVKFYGKKRQRRRLLRKAARECGEFSYIMYLIRRKKRKNE